VIKTQKCLQKGRHTVCAMGLGSVPARAIKQEKERKSIQMEKKK
jgi:hypothetical protein